VGLNTKKKEEITRIGIRETPERGKEKRKGKKRKKRKEKKR